MVATRLMQTRIVTVASRAYLDAHGHPGTPEALTTRDCIQFRNPVGGRPFDWEFRREDRLVSVRTSGRLIVADVDAMLSVCLSGSGIAQIMRFGAERHLASGALVDLFPDWPDELFPLHAVLPSRNHVPAKAKAFIAFCRDALRQHDLGVEQGDVTAQRENVFPL